LKKVTKNELEAMMNVKIDGLKVDMEEMMNVNIEGLKEDL